jgi:bisphosphoglycerate-dependent phosphoglycerate mutase
MKQINTISIENYLEKTRIANKSGQKHVKIDIKEAVALADCLAVVMVRLVEKLEDHIAQSSTNEETVTINMDGGGLR